MTAVVPSANTVKSKDVFLAHRSERVQTAAPAIFGAALSLMIDKDKWTWVFG